MDKFDKEDVFKLRRIWSGTGHSFQLGDPMLLMRAIGAAEHDAAGSNGNLADFCQKYGLIDKAQDLLLF